MNRMVKVDAAVEAMMQIAMVKWLRVHPHAMRIAWVVVLYEWLFAIASYWADGSWPTLDGVQLFAVLSFPLVSLPLMALGFRKASGDLSGPYGFAAFHCLIVGIPLTVAILAIDALIMLASIRTFFMTGSILPAL